MSVPLPDIFVAIITSPGLSSFISLISNPSSPVYVCIFSSSKPFLYAFANSFAIIFASFMYLHIINTPLLFWRFSIDVVIISECHSFALIAMIGGSSLHIYVAFSLDVIFTLLNGGITTESTS